MSKKKNTLKDLDEFLKQQAATLVEPVQLGDTITTAKPAAEPPANQPPLKPTEVSGETILHDLEVLAQKEGAGFRKKFYELIVRSIETQGPPSPEDKMLINTALYLKGGTQWKETIRAYWKGKP